MLYVIDIYNKYARAVWLKDKKVLQSSMRCHDVVVITTAQLFQQNQNSDSAQVQILFVACQIFAIVRISEDEDSEDLLLVVNHTTKTIHHHYQCISRKFG